MKKKKYLPLYYKWMRLGQLPGRSGLCLAFYNEDLPYCLLHDEFLTSGDYTHDKYRSFYTAEGCDGVFTSNRQNIVLFLAAMNNEL